MELVQQIKEILLPKLELIRQEQVTIRDRLNSIDMHLVDQSRRIDETNKRIDETNKRIDTVHADLLGRIEKVHAEVIQRYDKTNMRLDRLYEVIVRREEHEKLELWVRAWAEKVDQRLDALERRVA